MSLVPILFTPDPSKRLLRSRCPADLCGVYRGSDRPFHPGSPAALLPLQQPARLLATGGGAFNSFLIERLRGYHLQPMGIEIVVPDHNLVNYKEALIMALIGVLRWREEYTVIDSVTGAHRSSIGGALGWGRKPDQNHAGTAFPSPCLC